jgi:GntR family transcriptional regulator
MTTPQHRYLRIAESIRTQIRDGVLAEGDRLPSVKDMAQQHGVATATVHNAYTWLQLEGYVRSTPRGTFVAESPAVAPTSHDRLARLRRTGSILAKGEYTRATSADVRRAPDYVADLFSLDPGTEVVRREFTTGKGSRRLGFAVHWYPAEFAAAVPGLATTSREIDHAAAKLIEEATGRTVKHGRDSMHGREATDREASHLALRIGAPVLAQVHEWSDDQGIIEYGEWVLPTLLTIGYEYAL